MARVFFSLLSMTIFFALAFAQPALAVNCDINTCISICSKGKAGTASQNCNSWCQITIADRKKSGQCK
jgi:hypothetical protein